MQPVKVTWKDAHACYPSWAEPNSIEAEDFICETVGWLLDSTTKPGWHVVVLSRTADGLVGDGISIPDGMVLKCEHLTVDGQTRQG